MNYKYPLALWTWVRENDFSSIFMRNPSGLPKPLAGQLAQLKAQLVSFGHDYPDVSSWKEAHGTFQLFDTQTISLQKRATRDALSCAELALPLLPYLTGRRWGVFASFMRMPAVENSLGIVDSVLKDDKLRMLLKSIPELRLIDAGTRLQLIAEGRNGARAGVDITLPAFPHTSTDSATVENEVYYLQDCRQYVQAQIEAISSSLVEDIQLMEREIAEFRQSSKPPQDEITRAGQLLRNFRELLSDADRDLLRRHASVFEDVFGQA